jgi:hypothetical protein
MDSSGLHIGMGTDSVHLEEGGKMFISGALGATGVKTISTFLAGFLLVIFCFDSCSEPGEIQGRPGY